MTHQKIERIVNDDETLTPRQLKFLRDFLKTAIGYHQYLQAQTKEGESTGFSAITEFINHNDDMSQWKADLARLRKRIKRGESWNFNLLTPEKFVLWVGFPLEELTPEKIERIVNDDETLTPRQLLFLIAFLQAALSRRGENTQQNLAVVKFAQNLTINEEVVKWNNCLEKLQNLQGSKIQSVARTAQ